MIDNKLALIAREFIIIVLVTEITLFYDRNNCQLQLFTHLCDTISTKMKTTFVAKTSLFVFFVFFFAELFLWFGHKSYGTKHLEPKWQTLTTGKSQEQEQLSSFFCISNLLCLCICVKPEAVQPNWSRWSHKMMCCLIGADSGSLKKSNLNTNSCWQHALHHELSLWLSGHRVIVTNSTQTQSVYYDLHYLSIVGFKGPIFYLFSDLSFPSQTVKQPDCPKHCADL